MRNIKWTEFFFKVRMAKSRTSNGPKFFVSKKRQHFPPIWDPKSKTLNGPPLPNIARGPKSKTSNGPNFFYNKNGKIENIEWTQVFSNPKRAEFSPSFNKKSDARLGACPCAHSSRIMMRDVPPRPTPFPLPSKAPTFWGFGQCQGWGWVGARAGLVLGMITPPISSTPLPLAPFFSGRHQGKGGRRRPYDALIFPAPSPTCPSRCHARSWRGTAILNRQGGEEAGTGYQRPPYHPET